MIKLSKATFQLKLYWESTLFVDTCQQKSLNTDWHPGGWFDAVHGTEQRVFHLNLHDTVIFTHTTHHYITPDTDTIDVLFITLASENNIIAGIQDLKVQITFKTFPNPTTDLLTIQLSNPYLKINTVQIFDLSINEYQLILTDDFLDLCGLSDGLYLIRLTM